ncbi:nucleoside diphosphate kinase regulator [Massilia niastensis]|uniref:nucleoside diphosphate kinase regulator n=1 Tax=Massilia niastensis TaxID=544911 RepID=UPI0003693B5B|nr:nucleoside diphosphate kinase regulator [Massilia niastensis]
MDNPTQLIVSLRDLERLEALLEAMPPVALRDQEALMDELDRADIRLPQDMPPDVVTMNSTVRFALAVPRKEFCLTLVYPEDAGGEDRISVFAPVGSALLGLAAGTAIEWPRPRGGLISIELLEVVAQPEREGDYLR